MSEQAKTELSMRDRLIKWLDRQTGIGTVNVPTVADSVAYKLLMDASNGSLDAIKFVFEVVDGPAISSVIRLQSPPQVDPIVPPHDDVAGIVKLKDHAEAALAEAKLLRAAVPLPEPTGNPAN